jgi:hypothetical protein
MPPAGQERYRTFLGCWIGRKNVRRWDEGRTKTLLVPTTTGWFGTLVAGQDNIFVVAWRSNAAARAGHERMTVLVRAGESQPGEGEGAHAAECAR